MKIIKPPKLVAGDTIGIITPSYPKPDNSDPDYLTQYNLGIKTLKDLGFKVREAKNVGKIHWWSGGTKQDRSQDINELFMDNSVKAIIAHDGGGGAVELLDRLDYALISKNPKPLIGFSDITNLHLAILTKTGLIGFQGPLSTYNFGTHSQTLSEVEKELEQKTFYQLLTSPDGIEQYPPSQKWEWWRTGHTQGRLFGGNLSMVSSLVGTKYFPSHNMLQDTIFYWEVDNITRYHVYRSLYQLRYAGLFNNIQGMVIGRLPGIKLSPWEFANEPSIKEIIMDILSPYQFPILSRFDSGHEGLNLTLPIGIEAELNSEANLFRLLEGAVS